MARLIWQSATKTQVYLLHNEKNGTFKDVTKAAGITNGSGPNVGLTFIDYDHDGDLDLYVVRSLDAPAPGPGEPIRLPSGLISQATPCGETMETARSRMRQIFRPPIRERQRDRYRLQQ